MPVFSEYRDDPCGFAERVLGLRLWEKQRRILEAIASKRKVAICSGQKTGKTTTLIVAALWWASTRPRARVFLTANTGAQVRTALWKELRRIVYLQHGDGHPVAGQLVSGPDVLGAEPALLPATGMQWPDGREIIGGAADTPEATQGLSSPELLIVIDEGAGVDNAIFEAFEGNCAAGGHLATASNPTQQSGWFFDAFHSKREFWETIRISSEESPNITGAEPAIEGLADEAFVERTKAEYGADSQFYLVRVLGQFAGTASNAIIGLALVDAAKARAEAREADATEPLELGVDAARFGDDESVIAPRRGYQLFPLVAKHGLDGTQLAEAVIQVVRTAGPHVGKVRVKIDATGGYGASATDILRKDYGREVDVIEVNASSKSDDEDKFFNLRSQLHFGFAEWLKDGGELPEDKRLDVELLTPTYSFDARRRFKVESKDEIKKRIKRSPDRADAAFLAIYSVAAPPPRTSNKGHFRYGGDMGGFGRG